MRTFASIKGLPVFIQQSGAKAGVIEELCLDEYGNVYGFIIDVEGFLKRDRYLPLSQIHVIGEDGVIIANEKAFLTKPSQSHIRCLHDSKKGICGKSLYTTQGQRLGIVADVYFQEHLGKITGYEVSDGFFADLTEGKKVIPVQSSCSIGEEAVFIDELS